MSENLKLDLLVFGAHPDDAEIGMGGTIAKASREGQLVGLYDLTLAEMSSNGDPKTRQQEAARATKLLGLAVRGNLELPDRGLQPGTPQSDKLVEIIRRHRPRVVFAPYFVDRHPDHIACSRLAEEAAFNAKLRRYLPHLDAWNPEAFIYYFINDVHAPQLVVDITEYQSVKMEALAAYRSQFAPMGEGGDWVPTPLTAGYLENVAARDRLFGAPHRLAYAEGFIPKGSLKVERF